MLIRTASLLALAFPLAALPMLAQSAQPPAQSSQSQSGQTQPQKEKKVWTNDDLSQLTGFVTTASAAPAPASAGAPDAQAASGQDGDKPLSNEQDPKWYRSKLEPLRAQLTDLDGKVKDIEDALNNPIDGKNAIKINQQAPNFPKQDQDPGYQEKRPDDRIFGNQTVRPQDQLTVLKQKRDAIQQQIDDLESLARRNGINPGDIR